MTEVGIDAVEIWTGKLTLDLANTFAPAKGEDPEKYTKGLGLNASSFPDTYEDIVTMGANAAHRLMEHEGLEPEDIGRIDVATESAFDNSKPVSTYIAGCLEEVFEGEFSHANKGERKFACVAGTQSIDDAYNWIKAGRHRGRSALVIATDTASRLAIDRTGLRFSRRDRLSEAEPAVPECGRQTERTGVSRAHA